MKNKGFTLIEILAVIVILGIVMMIAIPNITKNIMDSRKTSYLVDAQRYVESARQVVESGKIPCSAKDVTYYIPQVCLPVEKGQKSPYGDWKALYVVVTYDGLKHQYYFTSTDSQGIGINLTHVDDLTEDKIINKKKKVSLNVTVGNRGTIKVYKEDCTTTQFKSVTDRIDDKE